MFEQLDILDVDKNKEDKVSRREELLSMALALFAHDRDYTPPVSDEVMDRFIDATLDNIDAETLVELKLKFTNLLNEEFGKDGK